MRKIGIMGGTFNPIHNAHIAMGLAAYNQACLDEVWFMPSQNPPHKSHAELADATHRANMIIQAVEAYPGLIYSDFELQREGTTYTAETLSLLKQRFPMDRFYFIMGGDSFFQLESWHLPERIMEMATILAIARPGNNMEQMNARALYLTEQYHAQVQLLSMKHSNISSSQIREYIQTGKDIHEMVPSVVQNYIQVHHLYQEV